VRAAASTIRFEQHAGAASAPLLPRYRPRQPQRTLLHRIVHQHLETMLDEAAAQTDHGFGYPRFIARNFRTFLGCGDLSRGFARLRCKSCGYERLLAFSCKSRICPSCHARRMHDTAFHLEQNVLPRVPYRQWTMTFPRPIRYLMARDRETITAICAIFVRALFAYQRREANKAGYDKVLPGAITFVQTFGSALNLNIHFHTLLMDGVFIDTPVEEPITFLELPFVSQQDVDKLLLKIARRVTRLVESTADDRFDDDDLDTAALAAAQASATMATLPTKRTASLLGDADQRSSEPAPERCASGGGFSLHANVSLRARDRKGLLRLIRYGARQCFSQDRLSELPDARIRYRLSRPWGKQRAITLQPTALLHRLAALIPAPYVNLTRYHGCFAPNARRRREVINLAFRSKARARRRPSGDASTDQDDRLLRPLPAPPPVERSIPWAELLQKTFKIDVLECPECQGRLSIIAFITDVIVVGKILAHLRLPTASEPPRPSRFEEQLGLDFDIGTDETQPLRVIDDESFHSSCRDPPA
jgi:hypothetical protein